jgi:hypothetical protein
MVTFRKVSNAHVDLMHKDAWDECVACGAFIPSDGTGHWAKHDDEGFVLESDVDCFSTPPEWATHVCWYNK